jgi:hypothetical protein
MDLRRYIVSFCPRAVSAREVTVEFLRPEQDTPSRARFLCTHACFGIGCCQRVEPGRTIHYANLADLRGKLRDIRLTNRLEIAKALVDCPGTLTTGPLRCAEPTPTGSKLCCLCSP